MEDFYSAIYRRPFLDIIPEEGETEFWKKNFESSNDTTLYSWRNDWKKNMAANLAEFKYFNRDHSVKVFFNELVNQPVIIVGAGPSLAKNIDKLKAAKEAGIAIMSSHHAVMYLAANGIKPDFVVCLDAGHLWDEYFAHEDDWSDVPLLTDETCNTEQLKKWEGPKFFFRSTMPESTTIGKLLKMELDRIVNPLKHGSIIEVGGHVLGCCMSLARGVMMANTVIFIGADYCFTNDGKFYPFDFAIDKEVPGEHFEKPGQMLPAAPPAQGQIFDIFGNVVATNGAYLGFKNVMDQSVKVNVLNALQHNDDLEFVNASEGGALGALKNGLSKWMSYLTLEDAITRAVLRRNIKGG